MTQEDLQAGLLQSISSADMAGLRTTMLIQAAKGWYQQRAPEGLR
jgi:hypothetical protein